MSKNKKLLLRIVLITIAFILGGLIGLSFLRLFNNSLWSILLSLPAAILMGYGLGAFEADHLQ